uniref:STAS domain-containing protein n=1 Tax=Haptolina brevifila TaxID=156173 RepID=A0A7S2BSI9_9EUKA|mmetsp:Transcript_16254/g.32681  ORF Transcript_16254/g.32681 Transcript_16254/m.32681 type:complete len:926 (+) Transcript_16254:108-2885(+)|eukprot:CAMPEP_0174699708 /NCGR_PEP_ID=MMETSP1094-20130205/4906_1 /TAXON_ID=156173 /ORGANISM="Chrysochromulina brevifilum, Strain UTEX LB 985" /LENGTH=925 /DNA_ID=CAMNT_0015897091 /DNA_START=102 /DNA_END=2879 /DNA_ORIENTATION=+
MDAFAENQMGRGNLPPTPTIPRSRRPSREVQEGGGSLKAGHIVGGTLKATMRAQDLPSEADMALLANGADLEDQPVDVPGLTIEESKFIAARLERKKSSFMPVGDPYAEPDTAIPYTKRLMQHYCTCQQAYLGVRRLAVYLFPVISWAPKINKASLRADVIAGLTVGVMLIPQSMSYADIAGLEYRYGMYTSVLPVIVYALMGSSRQLGVGPVAMVSLLIEVGLQGALTEEECPAYFAQQNSTASSECWENQSALCPDAYAHLVFLTSLLVGIFQLSAGILKLGFLVSFLAHPVISGFTSAAAVIIGLSQLQYFLGYKIPKSQFIYETLGHVFTNLEHTKYQQLLFGLAWWFMLSMSRRLAAHPKYKKKFGWLRPSAPLLTCGLAIVIAGNMAYFNGCGFRPCDAGDADGTNATVYKKSDCGEGGIKFVDPLVVGKIPSGVSDMASTQYLDFSKLSRVLTTAVSCSVIGYMESIAIAKSLAAKHNYEVDPGQELIALGIANMLGSTTSAYPVTGSFSRSAVNNQVGAQTQLAGLITGLLLLFTLLALTPVFEFLPKFALAAIVIASVTNLVDYKECLHLWKVKKPDCLLWLLAFFGTLFLGVQIGLLVSVGASLALVILESVRPQMSVLWRLPNTPIYRNIKQESEGVFVPGVVVMRIGASMYFANVAFIRDYITKLISEFSEASDTSEGSSRAKVHEDKSEGGKWLTPEPIRYIVMEMTPVISIDSTALHMLEDMCRDLKARNIHVAFSTVGNRVEDTLKRAGLIDKMGEQWIHPSVHSAVQHCIRHRLAHLPSDVDPGSPDQPDGISTTRYQEGNGMMHVRDVEIVVEPPPSERNGNGTGHHPTKANGSAVTMDGAIMMNPVGAVSATAESTMDNAMFDHLDTPSGTEYRQAYQRHRQGGASGARGEGPVEAPTDPVTKPNEI